MEEYTVLSFRDWGWRKGVFSFLGRVILIGEHEFISFREGDRETGCTCMFPLLGSVIEKQAVFSFREVDRGT